VQSIRLTEIFLSLQGESQSVGLPTVFVRLTGCPLRCHYCDTEYAFKGGTSYPIEEIIQQVRAYRVPLITVTGGEPLAQKACRPLLHALCEHGLSVSLETSGALSIDQLDPRVHVVMDIKTPDSGEMARNRLDNLALLRQADEVKFVINSRADYDWCNDFIMTHELSRRCQILFSPVQGNLSPTQLADWIIHDRLAVRFQIQLHKFLWGDQPGK